MKNILLILIVVLSTSISLSNFTDIKNSPYSGAIDSLSEIGIIKGYSDGTFRPKNNITRAELVKLFFEAKKIKKVPFYGCFYDINVDSWFAQSICQSKQMLLITGFPNGTFKPNSNATFAEGLKIGMGIFGTNFRPTTSWYKPYIDLVERKNIFGKKISYSSLMTREQASQLAFAMINQYNTQKVESSSSSYTSSFGSSSVVKRSYSSGLVLSGSVSSSSSVLSTKPENINVSSGNNTISSSSSSLSSSSISASVYSSSGISSSSHSQTMIGVNSGEDIKNSSKILPKDFKKTVSLGCGKQAPKVVPNTSYVNGVSRKYIIDIPQNYNENTPTKLVIWFHGRTNSNKQFRDYTNINDYGNAIVVYPSALPENTSPRNWADPKDGVDNLRDFSFFDQILIDLTQDYCIDKSQIFVVGHSLGGRFSNTLGCARGDVIAGVGTVGGSISKATCVGNPSYMIMHNPLDNLAPYKGGLEARDYAIKQNECDINSQKTYLDGSLSCVEYSCKKSRVVWCPHNESNTWGYYYPHTWPKNATKMILDFFSSKN